MVYFLSTLSQKISTDFCNLCDGQKETYMQKIGNLASKLPILDFLPFHWGITPLLGQVYKKTPVIDFLKNMKNHKNRSYKVGWAHFYSIFNETDF